MKLRTHFIYISLLIAAAGWIVFTKDASQQSNSEALQLNSPSSPEPVVVQSSFIAPTQNSSEVLSDQLQWSETAKEPTVADSTFQSLAKEARQIESEDIVQGTPSLSAAINNHTEQINRRFNNESIDQQWAYQRQTELEDIFYVEETLRDLDVDSVECRETLCQIRLNENTNDMFRRLMDIQRVIIEKELSSTSRSYLIEDEVTNEYRVFIQR